MSWDPCVPYDWRRAFPERAPGEPEPSKPIDLVGRAIGILDRLMLRTYDLVWCPECGDWLEPGHCA